MRNWLTEISFLPLKMIAAYGFILFIVPRYFLKSKYSFGLLTTIALLVVVAIMHRLQLYHFSYPLLYDEYPNYDTLELKRILYTIADIVPAMALLSTVQLIRNRITSQYREQELLKQKLESELRFLKAQTNPHFLFNTMNSIYALARKNSPTTSEAVLHLSGILRFMLYECNEPSISLESEIKIIKDYIQLEKIRFNKKLDLREEFEMDNPNIAIAPMLLLPLVENAFKHGVGNSRFKSEVSIQLILKENLLNFKVENSFEPDNEEEINEGIGISNVKRQLELIYPNRHVFNIKADSNMFKVQLQINLSDQDA